LSKLGDRRWRELLERHNELVRLELDRFQGREIKTIGDGFLATFDGPSRAIQCARSIRDSVHQIGVEIRAGIHTGECELMDNDVGGIAVHTASRSEEHTSELQSRFDLVCRLLLEKKK